MSNVLCRVVLVKRTPGLQGRLIWLLNWLKNPSVMYTHAALYVYRDDPETHECSNYLLHYTDKGVQSVVFRSNSEPDHWEAINKIFDGVWVSNDMYTSDGHIETLIGIARKTKMRLTWWDGLLWFCNRSRFLCHSLVDVLLYPSFVHHYTVDELYHELLRYESGTRVSYKQN